MIQLKNKHLRLFSYTATTAIFVIGATLYNTNYRVRSIQNELTHLNQEVLALSQSMHVLNAEWSYLNAPDRLKKLNEKVLTMKPVRLTQLASWKQLETEEKGPRILLAYKPKAKGGAG